MVEYLTVKDKIFNVCNYIVLSVFMIIVLYPLYFIVIASISEASAVGAGEVMFYPVGFNLDGYRAIFQDKSIWRGYLNSIIYTGVGTAIGVTLTLFIAYPLSRKDFIGRNMIMFLYTVTMFFGGGMIPTYIVIDKMGMLNSMWALVIPGAVGVWNVVITRTYIQTNIQGELWESASIDGCNNCNFFFKILVPLSKPIIAVMVLMVAVGHWNSYMGPMIYLTNQDKYPLQVILRTILIQNQQTTEMMQDVVSAAEQMELAEKIKYGLIIVSTLPVICIYPFIQKYFVKGMMIGSIKG